MKPKDRDFVESTEGLLFCLVGYLHPPDRYTAYLKYIPDEKGKWSKEGKKYRRAIPFYHVSQVENTYQLLGRKYPHHLFFCPVRNIIISSVQHKNVKTYYHPQLRLQCILEEGPRDALEENLINLIYEFEDISPVGTKNLGVTGSILTSSHNPEFSDIDLTVYGDKPSKEIKIALTEEKEKGQVISSYSPKKMLEWIQSRAKRHNLTSNDLKKIAQRRWNYGIYDDTYFSIHPIRTDKEVRETYGEKMYKQRGLVKGSAKIMDNRESMYLPAIYYIENVETRPPTEIDRIISYEGIYCDVFREGEVVEFQGVLESVTKEGETYRAVIGGAGSRSSYIKWSD